MASMFDRIKSAWNIFNDRGEDKFELTYGPAQYTPVRGSGRLFSGAISKDSIIVPIYNRIAIDVASVNIRHVDTDDQRRYSNDRDSELNRCFTVEANIDQTPRAFFQDCVQTLCERGSIAIVPVERVPGDPHTGGWDIMNLRVGEITQWYPRHVRVNLYNDETGLYEEIVLPKRMVAVVINPLYAVMNESNSTLQRLLRKLNLIDVIDEQSGSGKLDILVQLPYVVKGEVKKAQAEERRLALESQLMDSKYGIAYIDGTEKVTQLNRPADNNLMAQVEYLTGMLYSQLGITQEILNGTADEQAMINYHNRTIEPFLSAITDSMHRSFLSKTAQTQGQRITFFRDPFRLMPLSTIAEVADKFTRNEIASSNDMRSAIGWVPSSDPKADELRNSNLSAPAGSEENFSSGQNGDSSASTEDLDALESEIEEALAMLSDVDTDEEET